MLSPREKAKKLLWSKLMNRRFHGLSFSKERTIGPWTVDFYCAQLQYVIDVIDPSAPYDAEIRKKKEFYLAQSRLTLKYISSNDIVENVENCLQSIKEEIVSISPLARF